MSAAAAAAAPTSLRFILFGSSRSASPDGLASVSPWHRRADLVSPRRTCQPMPRPLCRGSLEGNRADRQAREVEGGRGRSTVLKLTWRNLFARKLRLALSAFAIVLGVAFVAGSFVFTDAMSSAFNGIVKGTTADVEVHPKGADDFSAVQDTRLLSAADLVKLQGLSQAKQVVGNVSMQNVWVIGDDGKLVGGNGPPGLAFNYNDMTAITGERIITLSQGDL